MEIIKAGNFVLGCSKETKDKIEDAIIRRCIDNYASDKTTLVPVIGAQEKIEEVPANRAYYNITYEKLEKLFEEMRIKHFEK